MSTLANRTIAVLRTLHDDLVAALADLSDQQLGGPSGASEWTLAQVLSHLGSGAEIGLATLRAAVEGTSAPGEEFAPSVWARWDTMSVREQATGFAASDAALVQAFEALTPQQRESLRVDLAFLPAPLPLAAFAGMRLSEAAQHSWDVRVGLDPAATLDPDAAEALLQHWSGDLALLFSFIGRADPLGRPATVRIGSTPWLLAVEDSVRLASSLESAEQSTATFTGEPEAAVRLVGGRLGTSYTPAGVEVTGNVTLEDLRRVFPGY